MNAPRSPLLTAQESMAHLRCSRSYLTEHADEIGCVRRGGRLLFYRDDLDRWNDRHYQRPALQAVQPVQQSTRPLPTGGRINPMNGLPYGALEARS